MLCLTETKDAKKHQGVLKRYLQAGSSKQNVFSIQTMQRKHFEDALGGKSPIELSQCST